MNRRLTALAIAVIAVTVAGCGGEEDGAISEGSLRDCLVSNGLSFQGATEASPSPGLGNVSADFAAGLAGGGQVDLVVEGSEEKAQRKAADIQGALQSFGVADAGDRLIAQRNVIAVFDRAPSAEDREAVSSCLD